MDWQQVASIYRKIYGILLQCFCVWLRFKPQKSFLKLLFIEQPTRKEQILTFRKHVREFLKMKVLTLICWLQIKADNIEKYSSYFFFHRK